MWHYERVMSERNTASLDTKASDAVNERLGGFALIGFGPTDSESSTSRRKCPEMPVHYSSIDCHSLQLEHQP
jgi:hypothetical protein